MTQLIQTLIAVLIASVFLAPVVFAQPSDARSARGCHRTQPTSTLFVIWPLDLVIALPALFWGGMWLWRGQPRGLGPEPSTIPIRFRPMVASHA